MRTLATLYILGLLGVVVVATQPPRESSSITITDIQGDVISCPDNGECVTTPSQQFIPRHWDKSDLEEM
jgi:hypothetical protein